MFESRAEHGHERHHFDPACDVIGTATVLQSLDEYIVYVPAYSLSVHVCKMDFGFMPCNFLAWVTSEHELRLTLEEEENVHNESEANDNAVNDFFCIFFIFFWGEGEGNGERYLKRSISDCERSPMLDRITDSLSLSI